MKTGFKLLFGGVLLVLLIMWSMPSTQNQKFSRPWQVSVNDGVSTVFSVTLGQTTIEEAINLFGKKPAMAWVESSRNGPVVELYYERVNLSGVRGKLIVSAQTLVAVSQGAEKRLTNGDRFFQLEAWQAFAKDKIFTVALLPDKNLSEEMIFKTFSQPTEIVDESEQIKHYLYADLGIDILLNAKGKDAIQYVSPENFHRVRAPLEKWIKK